MMQETIYEVLVYDNNFGNITTVSHLRLVFLGNYWEQVLEHSCLCGKSTITFDWGHNSGKWIYQGSLRF